MDGGESRYELIELIGSGGMAEVYRARMLGAVGFEKQVAIKRLLPQVNADQEFVQRFVDEARLTVRLVHPNICQILDFGTMDGCYFLAMEYVDGLDLAGLLRGVDREGERIPVDVALYVICGVLRGLKHAHEATDDEGRPLGIVHRDVSPHNVLLSVNGDIKLSDLGAATANQSFRSARTEKHFRLGKVLYMAPEQRRRKAVDARADLYSAGILLAEMILGQGEFHQEANMFLAGMCSLWDKVAARLASPLGQALSQVVEKALAEDPARRFQNADGMLSAIEGLLIEYAPGTSVDRVARLVQRLKRRRQAKRQEDEADRPEATPDREAERGGGDPPRDGPGPGEPGELDEVLTIARPNAPLRPRSLDGPGPGGGGGGINPFDDSSETMIQTAIHHRNPLLAAAQDQPKPPDSRWQTERQPTTGPTPPYLEYVVEGADEAPANPPPDALEPAPASHDSFREAAAAQPLRYGDDLSGPKARPRRPSSRRRTLLIAAILVPIVLVLGVSFGGLLATFLFPEPEPEPAGAPGPDRPPQRAKSPQGALISPTPVAPDKTPAPAPRPAPPQPAPAPQTPAPQPAKQPQPGPAGPGGPDVPDAPAGPAHQRDPVQPRPQGQEQGGFGVLNINSRPYGIPSVDGQQVGAETPVGALRVAAGRHIVSVRFPQSGLTRQRTVEVAPGSTVGVTITLDDQ